MPSIRKKTNSAGNAVYEIRVSRGRGKSYLTKRWEPPEGWSQKAIDREPLKWQAMIRLLIDTGVRRGEACALQWKNVDFKENRITFADNLCYTKDKGVYIDTPKNGRSRTMDVAPEVIELLRRLQLEQSGKALSPFVFSQERSAKPMQPTALRAI